MSTEQQANGGIGFLHLLALIFIALKLTGHVTWSWWWVLAPLWVPCVLVGAVMIGLLVYSVKKP